MTESLALERHKLALLRDLVEHGLEDVLPDAGDPPHRLHAAMRYAVLSPGKRIRPILALLTAQQLGCPLAHVLPAACALELVHAASLVLDDLPCMDDAATRRGQPSVHARYGEDVAVLTGVALLNEAYGLLGRATFIDEAARVAMVTLLARTVGAAGLIGGQEKDLRGPAEPSAGFISQLHHEKTGVLFVAATEMGALAAGAGPLELEALRTFAQELGLAFQALDDLDDEAELATGRGAVNLLSVLGHDAVRAEVARRLDRARSALAEGGPELAPMAGYVDLLFGRGAAETVSMPAAVIHFASFLAGLVAMEGVAWATHRYLMHGPLWSWHRSHHEPGGRGPELNDLFGLVFAGLAIGLFWLGAQPGLRPLWWAAMGASAYGVLYALVHDGLVHRRFPFPVKAERGYLLRLVQAHHLHHISHERDGAVSFGFLWAQDPERLRSQLRARRAA